MVLKHKISHFNYTGCSKCIVNLDIRVWTITNSSILFLFWEYIPIQGKHLKYICYLKSYRILSLTSQLNYHISIGCKDNNNSLTCCGPPQSNQERNQTIRCHCVWFLDASSENNANMLQCIWTSQIWTSSLASSLFPPHCPMYNNALKYHLWWHSLSWVKSIRSLVHLKSVKPIGLLFQSYTHTHITCRPSIQCTWCLLECVVLFNYNVSTIIDAFSSLFCTKVTFVWNFSGCSLDVFSVAMVLFGLIN